MTRKSFMFITNIWISIVIKRYFVINDKVCVDLFEILLKILNFVVL
jgi:hypothetical protein